MPIDKVSEAELAILFYKTVNDKFGDDKNELPAEFKLQLAIPIMGSNGYQYSRLLGKSASVQ